MEEIFNYFSGLYESILSKTKLKSDVFHGDHDLIKLGLKIVNKLIIGQQLIKVLLILFFTFLLSEHIKANDNAIPIKKSPLYVQLDNFDSLLISWDPNPEPDMLHYELYRAINNLTNFELVAFIFHPDSNYVDTNNISAGNLYAYTLIAVDTAGNKSENSDTVSVLLTQIEETSPQQKIPKYILHQNYPNPFNSETNLILYLPEPDLVTIKIYSLSGQLIKAEKRLCHPGIYRYKFVADHYPTGVYFYQISTAMGFKETRKMILQK